MLFSYTRFLLVSFLCSLCAFAEEKATSSIIEDNYLTQRASLFVALTKEPQKSEIHHKALRSLQTKTLQQLQSLTTESTAHSRWLEKVVKADTLEKSMPFNLMDYLPLHRYQTYNTFTVPVEQRTIINMEFKGGWQYTDGVKAKQGFDYQYTLETANSFRRTRPLAGGGVGTDVIHYNPLTNTFQKGNDLFMWKVKQRAQPE